MVIVDHRHFCIHAFFEPLGVALPVNPTRQIRFARCGTRELSNFPAVGIDQFPEHPSISYVRQKR
ncbi:MAG: hypothetical protein ACK57P_15675 [Planctomycetota bacterium]